MIASIVHSGNSNISREHRAFEGIDNADDISMRLEIEFLLELLVGYSQFTEEQNVGNREKCIAT
jgi:hypothetical protein